MSDHAPTAITPRWGEATIARDTHVWNGAVEILAAAKAVPFEHRFDAFALAFDAFVRTSGTIDIDYPEDRFDVFSLLSPPPGAVEFRALAGRYRLERWNERAGLDGDSILVDEEWSER